MGPKQEELNERWTAFIQRQKIFFVGTAAQDGHINVSPKGMDTLRVLGKNRLLWLSLTGSGNETAAHLRECNRMTIMFCAFEGEPVILRVYGHAKVIHPRDADWEELIAFFPSIAGARQIFDVNVVLAQTSCGMGVPYLAFQAERDQLERWAEEKGPEGIKQYWEEKNQISLDGKPTGMMNQ